MRPSTRINLIQAEPLVDPLSFNYPATMILDTSNISSLLNGSGVTPSDGDAIGTINSTVGSASFTQATGTKQGIYNASYRNGLPAIVSDGVDDTMAGNTAAQALLAGVSACTIFWVGAFLSYNVSAAGDVIAFQGATFGRRCIFGYNTGTGNPRPWIVSGRAGDGESNSFTNQTAGIYAAEYGVHTLIMKYNQGKATLRRNGNVIMQDASLPNVTPGSVSNTSGPVSLFSFGASEFGAVAHQYMSVHPGEVDGKTIRAFEMQLGNRLAAPMATR